MNWIEDTFRKYGLKVDSIGKCGKCGRGFKQHTDEELKECSKNE